MWLSHTGPGKAFVPWGPHCRHPLQLSAVGGHRDAGDALGSQHCHQSCPPVHGACTGLSGFLLQTVWAQTVKHGEVHANFSKFQMWGEQLNPFICLQKLPGSCMVL